MAFPVAPGLVMKLVGLIWMGGSLSDPGAAVPIPAGHMLLTLDWQVHKLLSNVIFSYAFPTIGVRAMANKAKKNQKGGMEPKISLAMMVKNEEKMLPRALASAAPWVDEIIVVDTGSTDRTVEIAESYGAKIYHHPWEHNFSIHRNQSIGYCTGDWVLILDADEELDQDTAPQMRQLVKHPTANCFLFKLYNDVAGGGATFLMHARLFRAGVGFHYEGLIHNIPTIPGEYAPSEVKLTHYGYNLDAEAMDAKHQRRLTMLEKAIDAQPQDYKLHAYLAQSLASKDESRPQAILEALEAVRLADEQGAPGVDFPRCYFPMMGSLFYMQRWDELIYHAHACLERMPHYPDPYLFLMHAHAAKENWQEVMDAGRKFFEMQELAQSRQTDFLFVENQTYNQFPQAYHLWCIAEVMVGNLDEAVDVYTKLINNERGEAESMPLLQKILRRDAPALALKLCEITKEVRPEWAWVEELLPIARQKAADHEFKDLREQGLQALGDNDFSAAIEKLEKVSEYFFDDAEIHFSLAKAEYALNQREKAKAHIIKGLNAHPGYVWGWRAMIDLSLAAGDARAACMYLERLLQINPGDQQARQLYEQAKVSAGVDDGKTVSQEPPELVVFLVGGLAPEMVRKIAPHFLMHRAWGELLFERTEAENSMGRWATLYTGAETAAEAFSGRTQRFDQVLGLSELGRGDIWTRISDKKRVGLLSIPLGHPAPALNGWSVSGYPGGLLTQEMVHPADQLPKVLTSGYRSDFISCEREKQLLSALLGSKMIHLARLDQIERNRIKLAMSMPAVDVLAIGFTCLEWAQQCFGSNDMRCFSLYQHIYGVIETTLAVLKPKHFAVLSQSAYDGISLQPDGNGFYCLSWHTGENAKAPATDIAPEIIRLLGL